MPVLEALPFRRLPRMLLLDAFALRVMLSLGSLAVAPLRPVDVGDGCTFCEEDLDGTGRSRWVFGGASWASLAAVKNSFSFCNPETAVRSDSSVPMVLGAVDVACVAWVEELGGWGASVAALDC
jgi:hypothetical protein